MNILTNKIEIKTIYQLKYIPHINYPHIIDTNIKNKMTHHNKLKCAKIAKELLDKILQKINYTELIVKDSNYSLTIRSNNTLYADFIECDKIMTDDSFDLHKFYLALDSIAIKIHSWKPKHLYQDLAIKFGEIVNEMHKENYNSKLIKNDCMKYNYSTADECLHATISLVNKVITKCSCMKATESQITYKSVNYPHCFQIKSDNNKQISLYTLDYYVNENKNEIIEERMRKMFNQIANNYKESVNSDFHYIAECVLQQYFHMPSEYTQEQLDERVKQALLIGDEDDIVLAIEI